MASGSFPQALLFAGPKGTGKTSSARIIGALLNDQQNTAAVETIFFAKKRSSQPLVEPNPDDPANQKISQGTSYVVQEMDAASHRGIDDIRQLRERLALPPQEGRIAVYILDEVHMLTTEAFNALLKVLEEPPVHVVFILATTELHKIPATITSRCTLVQFHKASVAELSQALISVLDQEKIAFEPAAIELIAKRAEGSFRDGVKLIENLAQTNEKLSLDQVTSKLVTNYETVIADLVVAVINKQATQVSQVFLTLREQDIDETFFFKSLLEYLYQQLMISIGITEGQAFAQTKVIHFLLNELISISNPTSSVLPLLPVELKLLDLIFRSQKQNGGDDNSKKNIAKPQAQPAEVKKNPPIHEDEKITVPSSSYPTQLADSSQTLTGDGSQLVEQWDNFLNILHEKNMSLELLLRSAKPLSGQKGQAIIQVYFSFHKEQLQQPKFLSILQECIAPITGGFVELQFEVAQKQDRLDTANIQPVVQTDLAQLAKDVLV
jgi:DNA polymerase III subunit gamma/tau